MFCPFYRIGFIEKLNQYIFFFAFKLIYNLFFETMLNKKLK
jgi:hypothetical protein